MRSRRTITLVMSLVLLLVVAVGYFAYANNLIPFLRISAGTIASSDGSVELHIPDGAQTPGTHITFTPDLSAAQSLNLTARGISALGSPVNIAVTNGKLAANRVLVTMKYNPLALPKGITPANLGMAVFDPNFDAWMPLGSTVNPQTHTVSATAPHFSLFAVVFLNPAKRIVHVGGIVISTIITARTTISQWFTDLLKQLTIATIKDLFGIAPHLTCSPVSSDLVVEAKSILNRLTACAQPDSKGDESLRMRNGYGFPLRVNTFPPGYTERVSDIFTNGSSDILNLLRNVYYHFRRQAVLSGADLGSVTVTPAQKGGTTLSLNLDAWSIAEDVGLTALFLFEPVGKVADAYGEAGLKAALQTVFTVGKQDSSGAVDWIQREFDILDCINTFPHNLPDLATPFSNENVDRLVEIGRSCISSVMEKFNLKSILVDILGSLKIVPEVVEATVAEALNKGLPPGFNPNTTSYSITVTRLITLNRYLVPDPPFGQGFTTDGDYVQVSGINGLEAVNDILKNLIVQDQQRDQTYQDYINLCRITKQCWYASGSTAGQLFISASSSVVSVLIPTNVNYGGVDNESWVSATLVTQTAKPITFADLFSDTSQALVAISEAAQAELLTTNSCVAADPNALSQGLDPTNPDNFKHYAISPSGLTIGFDRYQLGIGACSGPSVTIPWSQLQSYLSLYGRQTVSLLR